MRVDGATAMGDRDAAGAQLSPDEEPKGADAALWNIVLNARFDSEGQGTSQIIATTRSIESGGREFALSRGFAQAAKPPRPPRRPGLDALQAREAGSRPALCQSAADGVRRGCAADEDSEAKVKAPTRPSGSTSHGRPTRPCSSPARRSTTRAFRQATWSCTDSRRLRDDRPSCQQAHIAFDIDRIDVEYDGGLRL